MSREHPLAPHRIIPVVIIVILGVAAVLAVKGPDWYQRFYHPLAYEGVIAQRSQERGLDPYLVAAIINVESGYDANEVSGAGAVGLMQLMPDTAKEVARNAGLGKVPDAEALKDPAMNIDIGTLHLADLMRRFSTLEAALAAYNAGAGNTARWGRAAKASGQAFRDAIEYPETRQYISDVLEQRDVYVRLYPDAFRGAAK